MTSAIVTAALGKRYGAVTALEDLDLRVEPGEVFGFLGPNGAGKTTTIRLLQPSSGSAEVLGHPSGTAGTAVRGEIASVMTSQRRRVRATFTAPVDTSSAVQFGELITRSDRSIELLVARGDVPAVVRQLSSWPLEDVIVG